LGLFTYSIAYQKYARIEWKKQTQSKILSLSVLQTAQKTHTVNVDDTFLMGGGNCWHGIDGSYTGRVMLGRGPGWLVVGDWEWGDIKLWCCMYLLG